MANSEKDIIITPNRGSSTDDPKIEFRSANANANVRIITMRTYPTSNGTLSFEGNVGQLFSITNSLTGTLFSVNDISGIPSIEVFDTGNVRIAQYNGNVILGGTVSDGVSKLQVLGSANVSSLRIQGYGQVIAANGAWTGPSISGGGGAGTTNYIDLTNKPAANIVLSGDATGTANAVLTANSTLLSLSTTLANTGVSANTYGNATVVPVLTVDSKGRITSVSNVTISGIGGRSNPRIFSTTSNATITPDISQYDQYNLTALATNVTINASVIGTPLNGNKIIFRIKDDGNFRGITWDTSIPGGYRQVGTVLPANTSPSSNVLYVGCIYNSDETVWDVVAVNRQGV